MNVLIIGAGEVGALVARKSTDNVSVVGFLDDDPLKLHTVVDTFEVLGTVNEVATMVKKYHVDLVILALPSASGDVAGRVVKSCMGLNVAIKSVPNLLHLIDDIDDVNAVQSLNMEDLLRRRLCSSDIWAAVSQFEGKRIVITGGGGSIGSELSRQVALCKTSSLLIIGHGEGSLFKLRSKLMASPMVNFAIGDIRDYCRMDQLISTFNPDIIFHAAAHKHVGLMEENVAEAVTNNILGTRNLIEIAKKHNVWRFVMISTDKAVNPTSVMGASKRTAELLVLQALRDTQRGRFVIVRFGNVLGSKGSVVPIFEDRIARGLPLIVTHKDVQRFFMTIPEACHLVIQSCLHADHGDLFVLDMGEPVKIMDLAKSLLQLRGRIDLSISVIGLRSGEKLTEELFYDFEEKSMVTRHGFHMVFLHGGEVPEGDTLQTKVELLICCAREGANRACLLLLKELIPQCTFTAIVAPLTAMDSCAQKVAAWPHFEDDEIAAAVRVLQSGRVNYWTGEEGKEFEREFASYVGVHHAIAVSNGTTALELALFGLGVGAGDEVIVPSRTFIATASCVVARGAQPIVADVDVDSGNLTAATVQEQLSSRTKAIICVHLAGWPCRMDEIMTLAEKHGVFVVEDCAQSHGARFGGKSVGSYGHVSAFSFCQDKIMTTAGEGGMVLTDDSVVYKRMWAYKDHGKDYDLTFHMSHPPGYRWLVESFGTNMRLSEVQSAVGRVQLSKLDAWVIRRRSFAASLIDVFAQFPFLRIPVPDTAEVYHAYYKCYAYVVVSKLPGSWTRDSIMAAIISEGVPCYSGSCSEIYRENAFAPFAPPSVLPNAKKLGGESIMFLVHHTLSKSFVQTMCDNIHKVFSRVSSGSTIYNK